MKAIRVHTTPSFTQRQKEIIMTFAANATLNIIDATLLVVCAVFITFVSGPKGTTRFLREVFRRG